MTFAILLEYDGANYALQCLMCSTKFKSSSPTKLHCNDCRNVWNYVKNNAMSKTHMAVKSGVLPHPANCKCTDCGDAAYGYDHRDYAFPLMVDPVCRSCNYQRGPARAMDLKEAQQYIPRQAVDRAIREAK